jgi:methylated-DNA-[protein]-cysteine S-methyltransferase
LPGGHIYPCLFPNYGYTQNVQGIGLHYLGCRFNIHSRLATTPKAINSTLTFFGKELPHETPCIAAWNDNMTAELKYITFNTDMGWMGILGSTKGLLGTTLPQPSAQEACQLLGDGINYATWSPHLFENLIERLRIYLGGQKVTFPDELDLSGATAFQRQVWEITRLIPYGETRSYIWVAKQIKQLGAMRAVGQALARNPLPIIIPCHRVVASDGRLGGYSGGLEMKKYFLYLEAVASTG